MECTGKEVASHHKQVRGIERGFPLSLLPSRLLLLPFMSNFVQKPLGEVKQGQGLHQRPGEVTVAQSRTPGRKVVQHVGQNTDGVRQAPCARVSGSRACLPPGRLTKHRNMLR